MHVPCHCDSDVLHDVTCYWKSHHEKYPSASGRPRARAPHHSVEARRNDRDRGAQACCSEAEGSYDPHGAAPPGRKGLRDALSSKRHVHLSRQEVGGSHCSNRGAGHRGSFLRWITRARARGAGRHRISRRESVYVDAIDGGRVDRVLVEPGDMVQEGQPLVELSNTNLALQVIQEESQLNQAISQLQQNEITLEQEQLSNARALAQIDYNLVRLGRSAARREGLATKGLVSAEDRDVVTDELAYYKRLRPIQAESSQRQSELYARLLPDIQQQLKILRGNLAVVHDKLDSLIVRAPVTGKVASIDLKVGETPGTGHRLAEITPQTGMKLVADIDEFYLSRVRGGQTATVNVECSPAD